MPPTATPEQQEIYQDARRALPLAPGRTEDAKTERYRGMAQNGTQEAQGAAAAYHARGQVMSKYGNRKVIADGMTFDSTAEYRRYLQLKQLERDGVIRRLEVHPVYVLIEPFRDNDGKRQTAVKYTADFAYLEHQQRIAEDVKGVVTAVFALKAKLFKRKYPNIKLRIVKV